MSIRYACTTIIVLIMAVLNPAFGNASIKLRFYGADFVTVDGKTFRYPEYPNVEADLMKVGNKTFLQLHNNVTFGFDQLVPGANRTSNDSQAGSKFRIKSIELDLTRHPETVEILTALSTIGPDEVLQFPENFGEILWPENTNRIAKSTTLPARATTLDPRFFRVDYYQVQIDTRGMDHNGTSVSNNVLIHPSIRAFFNEVTHSSGMTALGSGPTAYIDGLARLLPRSILRDLKDLDLKRALDAEFHKRLSNFRDQKKMFKFTDPDPVLDTGSRPNAACKKAFEPK